MLTLHAPGKCGEWQRKHALPDSRRDNGFRVKFENVRHLHVQEELVTSGYMRAVSTDGSMAAKAKAKTRKSLKQQRLSAFRQFTSTGGFQILVGRNNRQNDELTHSIAKAADTWLHARGVPGEVQGFRW